MVALFEAALARGALTLDALFDRRHVPIPGTAPTKYHTQFDAFTDQTLPGIQEPILARDPAIAYAIVTDDHGYVPTHNDRFSAAPTGDPAVDLARSRSKRIFDDRTGQRCGKNQHPYLLQTYQRDTGEVMHDLSVPIASPAATGAASGSATAAPATRASKLAGPRSAVVLLMRSGP